MPPAPVLHLLSCPSFPLDLEVLEVGVGIFVAGGCVVERGAQRDPGEHLIFDRVAHDRLVEVITDV